MILYVTALCFFILWMFTSFFSFYDFKRKNPIPKNSERLFKGIIPTAEQSNYVMKGLSFERENSLFKKLLYYAQGIFFWAGLILWLVGQGHDTGFFDLIASTFDTIRDFIADFFVAIDKSLKIVFYKEK